MSKRIVSSTPRRVEDKRTNEAVAELTEDILERHPDLTRSKAEARARKYILDGQRLNPYFTRFFLETRPRSGPYIVGRSVSSLRSVRSPSTPGSSGCSTI